MTGGTACLLVDIDRGVISIIRFGQHGSLGGLDRY
jgi:hypothetical protein